MRLTSKSATLYHNLKRTIRPDNKHSREKVVFHLMEHFLHYGRKGDNWKFLNIIATSQKVASPVGSNKTRIIWGSKTRGGEVIITHTVIFRQSNYCTLTCIGASNPETANFLYILYIFHQNMERSWWMKWTDNAALPSASGDVPCSLQRPSMHT